MNKISGLGLIEILIALSVISLGIALHSVLYTQFQLHYASSRNQGLAWRLAEQKFDDLRDFKQLLSSADFDFNDIQNNTGGKQIEGSLLLPAGPVDKRWTGTNPTNFNLSWQVENAYWQNDQLLYLNPTQQAPYPDQKRISILVSWFEADALKEISVQGIVTAISPVSEILLYRPLTHLNTIRPVLKHQTASDTNSITISADDSSSVSTQIKVLNTEKASQILTETLDSQGHILKQSSFLTVSCQCQFAGTGYQKTSAYAYWDKTTQTLIPQSGERVLKTQGCALDETTRQCSTQSDTLCARCCQDHHDPKLSLLDGAGQPYCDPAQNNRNRCYNPFARSADYRDGQHPHYNRYGQMVSSGDYQESCRFRNINGHLEVYQDWYRLDLILLPWQWLQSNLNEYQTWLKASLTTVINNSDSFWGQIRPDDVNSNIQWPDKSQLLPSLNQTWQLKSGDSLLLSARGLYLDYMNSETISALKQQLSKNKNAISLIPFYELEINAFAPYCGDNQSGWCSSASNNIEVGSGSQSSPNGLSPGMLLAKYAHDSELTISFGLQRGNAGLIPFLPSSNFSSLSNTDDDLDKAEFKLQILGPLGKL